MSAPEEDISFTDFISLNYWGLATPYFVRFQTSAAMWLRPLFFWYMVPRHSVITNGCSTIFQSNRDLSTQVSWRSPSYYQVWSGLVRISWSWKVHNTPSQHHHPRCQSKETFSWLPCIDPIVPANLSAKYLTKPLCLSTSKSVCCKINIIWKIIPVIIFLINVGWEHTIAWILWVYHKSIPQIWHGKKMESGVFYVAHGSIVPVSGFLCWR